MSNRNNTVLPDGEKVLSERSRTGLSQDELAHAAGVSKSTIERIEKGKSCFLSTFRLIANALKLNPGNLRLAGKDSHATSPARTDYKWLIILDGMTYNRVGEIIYALPADPIHEISRSRAYLRSLEDFVFANVFFDTLGVDVSAWRANSIADTKNTFAKTLLREIDAKEIGCRIEEVGSEVPLQSFLSGPHRKTIESDIIALRNAPWDLWNVLIERETHLVIRDNNSFSETSFDYEQYFDQIGHLSDPTLFNLVPPYMIEKGIQTVRNICLFVPVSAAQSFVMRTLLTHIAIGCYYYVFSEPALGMSPCQDYLP